MVLLAKERASQLNAGEKALVPENNDKNTVLALREIGAGKISLKTIEDSAINKLRKVKIKAKELEDLEADQEDYFDKIYKGEISKSGTAILPSKRVRRIPEKITAVKDTAVKDIAVKDDEAKKDIKQTNQQVENDSISADNKTE